ncbi:MAG: DUF1844 domain-containing protein [Spirochaetes bacterium]|nr:DUF1844 domain-containing protein [Spirochaetota bacterium]
MTDEKMPEMNFEIYIMMISSNVLMYLGKVKNPATGLVECNIPVAKLHIDILRMMREKTRGNLSGTEDALLQATIANLEMRYLEAVQADKANA